MLLEYDKLLKSIVGNPTNILFEVSDRVWHQVTLPIKMRGLGILAPSIFLASAASSYYLVLHIIPPHFHGSPLPISEDVKAMWGESHDCVHPEGVSTLVQVEGMGHQENICSGRFTP